MATAPATSVGWSFLVIGEEDRQHRGNDGYDDQLGEYYSWDSTVPNHRRPDVGDLCVVRDSRGVLGVSWIDGLSRTEGVEKIRQRCPACESTDLKARRNMKPLFRCGRKSCRTEFDDPVEEQIKVTVYRAAYARNWREVDGAVTARDLERACLTHAKQHAIRPLDLSVLRRLLKGRSMLLGPAWWAGEAGLDEREIPGGWRPGGGRGRIGQGEFRRRLLERFGPVCAVTGPQPAESLEAIHLFRFADDPRHDLAGGLLLRADLHSLLDRGLIEIDENLKVRVDPSLRPYRELARLDGRSLQVDPDDPLLPGLRALLRQRRG